MSRQNQVASYCNGLGELLTELRITIFHIKINRGYGHFMIITSIRNRDKYPTIPTAVYTS
jgi:hypothetical protein